MGWDIPVDIYCERIDATFWSEPLNALTNAAFIVAACAAALRYRAAGVRDRFLRTLVGIVALIGIGSFAFHTLATRGAVLLDVIPITIFIYAYLALALRRFSASAFSRQPSCSPLSLFSLTDCPRLSRVRGLTARLTICRRSPRFPAIALWVQSPAVRRGVLVAAALFTVSLVLRTADLRSVTRFRSERISCGTC